jgi:hypothetical protein
VTENEVEQLDAVTKEELERLIAADENEIDDLPPAGRPKEETWWSRLIAWIFS